MMPVQVAGIHYLTNKGIDLWLTDKVIHVVSMLFKIIVRYDACTSIAGGLRGITFVVDSQGGSASATYVIESNYQTSSWHALWRTLERYIYGDLINAKYVIENNCQLCMMPVQVDGIPSKGLKGITFVVDCQGI